MRLVSVLFPCALEIEDTAVTTFVIENKDLYRKVIRSLYVQCGGGTGEIILSEKDETLKISNSVELITDFIGLEPDNKKLLNRIQRMLEEEIIGGSQYQRAMSLLSDIESLLNDVADVFSFPINYEGINIPGLIKMASPKLVNESGSDIESILKYMELVREVIGERLFVMVGMKEVFSDHDMQEFIDTVVLHKYRVLLMESRESALLINEQRLLLDNDICVI